MDVERRKREEETETNESEQIEVKLYERCQIQIAESPVQHDERILPIVGVPICQERANATENVLRQLEFDTCMNELQSSDKKNLWNALAKTRRSISKLKSMKLDEGLNPVQREIVLMTEKFFAKIKLFLLSIFRSDAIPKSVYIDLFTSFLDVCGIVTLSGEIFERKSMLAGDIYSGSPDLYLLPLNMSDTSLRTVGVLSYSDEEFQSECTTNAANSHEEARIVSQSTSPMDEIYNKQDKFSLKARMTSKWVQSLPTTFDKNLIDEMESSGPNANLQENALSLQRKRTFEGRIKQAAVKLSPTNAVINRIPIIITLAQDTEELEGTTEMQTSPEIGPTAGHVLDAPFKAPDGKHHFPTRLFACVGSAMEEGFSKSEKANGTGTRVGLSAGRIPDPSFQAPGRKLIFPTRLFAGVRPSLEQNLPSTKIRIIDPKEKSKETTDQQQAVTGINLTSVRVPEPSFQAQGRKINIPKGLFAGVRSAMEQEHPSTKSKITESGFAQLLLPVIVSSPEATEAKINDEKQRKSNAHLDDEMKTTTSSWMINHIVGNTSAGKTTKNDTTDNGSNSGKISSTDSDREDGVQNTDEEFSNEPGPSGTCKRIKLENTSEEMNFEIDHENIRNSAENNTNASSHVNSSLKYFCKCRAKSKGKNLRPRIKDARIGRSVQENPVLYNKCYEETIIEDKPEFNRCIQNTKTDHNLKLTKKNHHVKRKDQLTKIECIEKQPKEYYTNLIVGYKTEKNKGKSVSQRTEIIQKRKKVYRKKRRKDNHKERLSSDSGLPDSSTYTGNSDLTFHGRFDTDCQSSDSFLEEVKHYNNGLVDDERQIITVTPHNCIYSQNIKLTSEFTNELVEEKGYCYIASKDTHDEITIDQNETRDGNQNGVTYGNQTETDNQNETTEHNQNKTDTRKENTAGNQDKYEIYEIDRGKHTCLRSVHCILKPPLEVQDTSDLPIPLEVQDTSVLPTTSLLAFDKTSDQPNMNKTGNCMFSSLNGNISSNFGDKNINAITHDHSPLSVEFVQSLLLEWPNALTKPASVGFIIHKTKVIIAVLEMSHPHYEHLTVAGASAPKDMAEVNYTHVLDLLKMSDRICLARVLSGLSCIGR